MSGVDPFATPDRTFHVGLGMEDAGHAGGVTSPIVLHDPTAEIDYSNVTYIFVCVKTSLQTTHLVIPES